MSSGGEGALPSTARLPLPMPPCACAAARVGAKAKGRLPLPWDVTDGWDARVEACKRLLTPHGGVVGVSVTEPLPDELVTVAMLLLVPRDAFDEILAPDADDDAGHGNDDGHGNDGSGGVGATTDDAMTKAGAVATPTGASEGNGFGHSARADAGSLKPPGGAHPSRSRNGCHRVGD